MLVWLCDENSFAGNFLGLREDPKMSVKLCGRGHIIPSQLKSQPYKHWAPASATYCCEALVEESLRRL